MRIRPAGQEVGVGARQRASARAPRRAPAGSRRHRRRDSLPVDHLAGHLGAHAGRIEILPASPTRQGPMLDGVLRLYPGPVPAGFAWLFARFTFRFCFGLARCRPALSAGLAGSDVVRRGRLGRTLRVPPRLFLAQRQPVGQDSHLGYQLLVSGHQFGISGFQLLVRGPQCLHRRHSITQVLT